MFVSNTFVDFTPLYYRVLSPIYVLFSILLYVLLLQNKLVSRKVSLILISYFIIIYGAKFSVHTIRTNDGKELSSRDYIIPSTVDALLSIDNEIKIYTNEVDRVYYLIDGKLSDWLLDVKIATEESFYIVYFYNGRPDEEGVVDSMRSKCQLIISTDDLIILKYGN